MFSTILKEVTGYFDRRSLLSAFFPSVIAWATTLFLWVALTKGMSNGLADWEKQGALKTGLLILAFLMWCALWSFVTLNFRAGLTRLFEGHWPFALWLEKRRRNVHKDEYDRRDTDDTELDIKEFSVQALRDALLGILGYAHNPASSNQTTEAILDRLISDVQTEIKDWERLTIDELDARTVTANKIKEDLASTPSAKPLDATAWKRRRESLDTLTRELDQVSSDMQEERQRRVRNFDMYYPPGRHEVMPTKLGNVLSAADLRVGKRYQLDAGLIWSRLQPNLPKEFAESLQDSRMALDMMLTLSAFCLVFGVIQSLMLTYKLPHQIIATAPFILTILAPLVISRFFRVKTIWVAVATVVVLIVIPFIVIRIMVTYGFWSPLVVIGDVGLRVEAFLVLMTAYGFLAWIVYGNAVHAAVTYGEKVQSAFDLYRWKVFEGLQLQLPPGFADEQHMWREVCALLSRSKAPDGRYYRYVKGANTKEAVGSGPAVSRPVPIRDLPPYQRVSEEDLEMREVVLPDETDDIAAEIAEVADRINASKLVEGEPIALTSLIHVGDDTVVVGIPTPASGWPNETFQPGDAIDIVMVLPANENASPLPIIFENVLLLTAGDAVTVALPLKYRSEFSELSATATVVLTKRL